MGLILYEPLPRPTALNPRLPRGIDGWWQRAAARDRVQRFQSAKELADALGSALGIETVVNVPAVSPRRTISFPDLDEASGIFTPLTAKRPSHALSERIACPSESAILDGLVPVVGEQQREPDARESNARSSGLPWTDRWFRRRLTSRSVIVLWLAVGIPAAGAAISLIVILALRLLYPAEPYRSATTLRVDASGMQVTKADLQDVPTVPAAAPSALSVDMLPLESTTAEPNDKSLSVDAGSTKSTSTKPAPLRTIGPGRKVPGGGLGAEPRSVPDDVRDYGI